MTKLLQDVLSVVCDITMKVLGVSRAEPDREWQEHGADSLGEAEIVMALEEEFDIAVPDAVAECLRTPEEAAKYVAAILNGEEPPVPPKRLPWRQRVEASFAPTSS